MGEARLERARARMQERQQLLKAGMCPICKQKMDRRVQRGRHIVAEPCGHDLGQGRA